jgi:hypothetical protein
MANMSKREAALRSRAKTAEEDIRKQLNPGESLLCYSILGGGKKGVGIFLLFNFFLFAALCAGVFFIDYTPNERIFYSIFAGAMSILSLYSGLQMIKESKYIYCFITENKISFLTKTGDLLDIGKEEIKKLQYIPKGTVSAGRGGKNIHNFIKFSTYGINCRKKKYSIVPLFNAKEMAETLHQISAEYHYKKFV